MPQYLLGFPNLIDIFNDFMRLAPVRGLIPTNKKRKTTKFSVSEKYSDNEINVFLSNPPQL